MHLNFMTLFDKNYMDKGLAMYYSLNRWCNDYTLYVFAFDQISFEILNDMKLPNMVVLSENELLDEKMKDIKNHRSRAEYCWTCSSVGLYYLMSQKELDNCTYVDSDLYFFENPRVLIDEMISNKSSVQITDHRLNKTIENFINTKLYGKYCVQFCSFLNDDNGMAVLKWWKDRCLECCSVNGINGTYGDQKYQDNWVKDFEGVHEMQHMGGGVAPWNIGQYLLYDSSESGITMKIRGNANEIVPLIFFHFQRFRKLSESMADVGIHIWQGKRVDEKLIKEICMPYMKELNEIDKYLLEKRSYYTDFKMINKSISNAKTNDVNGPSLVRIGAQKIVGLMSGLRYRLYGKMDIMEIGND